MNYFQLILEFYDRAVSGIMKDSQLLYFAYADFEEERRNYDNVKKIYDRLLSREIIDPTLVSFIIYTVKLFDYFFSHTYN